MARRKKSHKGRKRTGRRRRVGGISLLKNDTVMLAAGVIASNVAGRFVTSFVKKSFPSVDSKIMDWAMAAGQGVGGYMLSKKAKSPLIKGAGIGFMASGVGQALTNVGVKLSGIPTLIPSRGRPMVGYTPNGGYPTAARVGNAANTFPQPGRVGRMNKNHVMAAGAAM